MIYTRQKIVLAECRAHRAEPVHMLPRETLTEQWLVAWSALAPERPVKWLRVVDGPVVHVPVFRYFTVRDPGDLAVFVFGLGCEAVAQFPGMRPPLRIHIVYADVIEDTVTPANEPAFAVYLGLALQVGA